MKTTLKKLTSPYLGMIIFGALTFSLSKSLSFDAYVNGPMHMLLTEHKTYLEEYISFLQPQKSKLILYYLSDCIFLCFVFLSFLKYYFAYISPKFILIKVILGTCLFLTYAFVDFLENITAFSIFFTYYNTDANKFNTTFYELLYNIKTILIGISICVLLFTYIVNRATEKYSKYITDKKKRKVKLKEVEIKDKKENTGHNKDTLNLKETLFRTLASILLSIAMFTLLTNVDQGPILVYTLLDTPWQFTIVIFFLVLLFWMSLINPYYSFNNLYQENQYAITPNKKLNKYSPLKLFHGMDWSSISFDEAAENGLISNTTNPNTDLHRMLALLPVWTGMLVACHIHCMYGSINNGFTGKLPYIIAIITVISVYIYIDSTKDLVVPKENAEKLRGKNKFEWKERKIKFVKYTFLASAIITIVVYINLVFDFFPFINTKIAKVITFIIIHVSTVIALASFIIFRRRIIFFINNESNNKNDIVFSTLKFLSNDRIGKCIIACTCIGILIFSTYSFYDKEHLHNINTLVHLFGFLVIWIFTANTLSSLRMQAHYYCEKNEIKLETDIETATFTAVSIAELTETETQGKVAIKLKEKLEEKLEEKEKEDAKEKLKEKKKNNKQRAIIHALFRTAILVLFLMWIKNTFIKDPQRHTIPLISLNQEKQNYNNDLLEYLIDITTRDSVFYLIANEGGGIRANIWSQLVLNKLDSNSGNKFYNRTIATCGASGGAIGQGLYHLYKFNHYDNNSGFEKYIEKFANQKYLGLDTYSLLFPRFLNSLVPIKKFKICEDYFDCKYRGDIYQARKYASMTTDKAIDILAMEGDWNLAIEDWWEKARRCNHDLLSQRHVPIPIINTAHIESGKEGVICPLNDNKNIFNGDHIINDFTDHPKYPKESKQENDESISYIDALFLANRFPLMSPVAIIPGKGNYHDAGTFDNSGISSLLDLMGYIEKKTYEYPLDSLKSSSEQTKYYAENWNSVWGKIKGNVHLVIIQNSFESYVRKRFRKFKGEIDKISTQENLKSNLTSAISTSAVKEYLHDVAYKKEGVWFKQVHELNLGYLIEDKEKLDVAFGGQLTHQCLTDTIMDHDLLLRRSANLSKKFYFKPPLGRVMAEPILDWMKHEVKSTRIENKINEVLQK